MWEHRSFDVYKNAAAPMIAMLDCSELNTEVLDVDMKTTDSDDCRGMSRKNGDTNSVLAMIQEGARFFCKNGWKFIDIFT